MNSDQIVAADTEGKVYHNGGSGPTSDIGVPAMSIPGPWMNYTTQGGYPVKPKRPRGWWYNFLAWLIPIVLPGFHITENPPKGIKRARKEKEQ